MSATQRGRPPSTETRIRRQYQDLLEEIGGGRIDYSPGELDMIETAVRLGQRIELLGQGVGRRVGQGEARSGCAGTHQR